MDCNSKENTLNFLKKKKILDETNIIINMEKFQSLNTQYTEYAKDNYGIQTEEMLFEIKTINKTFLSGSSYQRDNISTFYRAIPNEEIFKAIDEKLTSLNLESDELYSALDYFELYEGSGTPIIPAYEKYILYKQNLLRRLEDRLGKIKVNKKRYSSDNKTLKELTKQEDQIQKRIDGSEELEIKGIKEEILELEEVPAIDKFVFYTEKDFERLEDLSKSINPEDLHEARVIIKFYTNVGTFDVKEIHPILNHEDIFNKDGNLIVPKDVFETFTELKDKAKFYENIINHKEKKTVVDTINNNDKVKSTFEGKEFTHEELFFKDKGLKDTAWIDMFLMDITNGIVSKNGIVPQVMLNLVNNAFESNLVYAKTVETRMNELQANVEKELGKLGYSINMPGLKGVSYDLFRSTDANGQYKDSITQRYTSKYLDNRTKMFYHFDIKLNEARKIEDPSKKQQAYREAYAQRDLWYKKNTEIIDVRKIPEVINDSTLASFNKYFLTEDSEQYGKHLKEKLGEIGYKEEIEKQVQLLRDYQTKLDIFTDSVITEYEAESLEQVPEEGKNKVELWAKRNNPFIMVNSYYNNQPITKGKLNLNSTMAYNYSIPRNKEVKIEHSEIGPIYLDSEIDTDYYDPRFKVIEENETLKEFHTLLMEVQQKIFDTMPEEVRAKFSAFSLPTLKKNLMEILFDKNTPLIQRLSKAAREIYDRIRALFGINPQENLSYANVDPITGIPEYKVNADFLKANGQEINMRYDIEILRLKKALGKDLIDSISKYDTFDLTKVKQEVLDILGENLGVSPTLEAIQKRLPNIDLTVVELGKILKNGITHQVVSENSFDLPKIIKLFSYMTMEYAARQEVLPILEMMKNHYEEIKTPIVTNTGQAVTNVVTGQTRLEGERVKAIKQMDSWFERVVLGNYGSKNELGDTRIKRIVDLKLSKKDKQDSFESKIKTTITGRILNTDEKIIRKKSKELIVELENILNTSNDQAEIKHARALLDNLNKLDKGLGKHFAITAFFDAIFNFIRFKGLGWNLSSYITNFMEGQIANMIVAASGDYFKPENIYRANEIIKGSFLKNTSFGKVVTPGAKKTRALMDRYRILQDASNELQKASSKSAFSSFKNLSPYEGTRRTEYLNQAPLMIATLMDNQINSLKTVQEKYKLKAEKEDSFKDIKAGNKTSITRRLKTIQIDKGDIVRMTKGGQNVAVRITDKKLLSEVPFEEWSQTSTYTDQNLYNKLQESKDYEYYTVEVVNEGVVSNVWDALNSDGLLKEEFRTEENIKNWENADGDAYNSFKSTITKLIVNAHGDYHEIRGNMASEYIAGKAALMFKRWMSRQFYQRFAMTPQPDIEVGMKEYKGRYLSHTSSSGFLHGAIIGFGGLGLLGAGPLGLLVGGGAGLALGKFYGTDSGMNFLKELAFTSKELFLNLARIPVNNIVGKEVIKLDSYERLEKNGVSERDVRNLKANLMDMSLTLGWMGLLLFTKALLWDDKDDEDDTSRKVHNLLANRFMQLSSQAAMYVNPVETWDNTVGSLPIMRFLTDVGKTTTEAQDFLEGKDIIPSGPNAGESSLYRQFSRTFFPGIFKGGFGFGIHMSKQFQSSTFDEWFKSEEVKAEKEIKRKRAEYKLELENEGVPEEEIKAKVKEKYRYKKEGENSIDLLKSYE